MRRHDRRKQLEEPEVPTASLVDIAFLIIIFFIMTTTLTLTKGIVADVPSAQREEAAPQTAKTPTVHINADTISFNDKQVSLEQLGRELHDLGLQQQKGAGKVVMVEANGNVDYQRYFEIVSAISASGGVIAFVSK